VDDYRRRRLGSPALAEQGAPLAEAKVTVQDLFVGLALETAPAGQSQFTAYRLSLPAARRLLRSLQSAVSELNHSDEREAPSEEVASPAPLLPGMPAVGQRIQFLGPHPDKGKYGVVTEYKYYSVRRETLPVVILDNGVTSVVRTPQEWEAAGPLP
jgi:hypothetical protein